MENIDLTTARAVKMHELWNLLIDNGYRLVKVISDDGKPTGGASDLEDPVLQKEIQRAYGRAELARLESDVRNPQLVSALRKWRRDRAGERGVPQYFILSNRTLLYIAYHRPQSIDELLAIPGVGPAKSHAYGEGLLEIVARHKGCQE